MTRFPLIFVTCLSLAMVHGEKGDCNFYDDGGGNCANDCGRCANPGGRSGVMCEGAQPGYYCPSDNPNPMMAFACMDWTSGSVAMKAAEQTYEGRTGQSVYFGVGTYGTGDDPQRGLGACYLLNVDTVDKPLIVQSINTGSDVSGSQFDLQEGAGGCGAFNTCAGGSAEESMFPGSYDPWGNIYGGVDNKADCAGLPPYPKVDGPMKESGDSLIDMCELSFDRGYRYEGGRNPSIQDVSRVECPEELVEFTQMKRSDDPSFNHPILIKVNSEGHVCELPGSGAWCLTRMMDCRKPSGGWPDNVQPDLMVEGMRLTQPCTADGYTRIDVQCGCMGCYC